ncbi:MAG: 2-phosphoglycerate kinase, partial [Actinomycetota bacterium]
SSFDAGQVVKAAEAKGADRDLTGFVEQVEKVSVGVNAIIERSITEGTRMIVEGAHIVPGFLSEELWPDALVIQLILTVQDEDRHRGHFYVRDQETDGVRSLARYLANIDKIRRVQDYLMEKALEEGIPVIDNESIDKTINTVMGIVLDTVSEHQDSASARTRIEVS